MKIEYSRKLMSSYMILEQNTKPSEWENKMLRYSEPQSLIVGECVQKEEDLQIWYDITGKQSLDVVLQTQKLGYELFCNLLMTLYQTAIALEERLLNTDGILLDPEGIFLGNDDRSVFFCYSTGIKKDGIASFESFMEKLLPHLDHTDETCVDSAYAVYELACRESFGLALLKDVLHLTYEKEREGETESGFEETVLEERDAKELEEEQAAGARAAGSKKRNLVQDAVDHFTHREHVAGKDRHAGREHVAGKDRLVGREHVAGKDRLSRKENIGLGQIFCKKRKKPEEPFVFEPDEEERVHPQSRPTVLLSDLERPPEGILYYEGTGNGKSMRLEETTTVIGSDDHLAACIPSATVSRRHARITREGDTYWLEDLNSANGTYLDGKILAYKERKELCPNQSVRFADETYRFL